MAEIEHWNRPGKGQRWNRLKLGGKLMPGVATVTIDQELAKLDEKKAKGKQKAKQTNEGPGNAKVSISLQLEPDEDLILLREVLPFLRPTVGRKPSDPLAIEHPLANDAAQISTIVLEKVRWSHPNPVSGWVIAIEATEFVPEPKASAGLGKGAKGGGAKTCAQKAHEAQAAAEQVARTQSEFATLQNKRASGALLKSTEVARISFLEKKFVQDQNIFLAAVAAAESCKSSKPPSQSAKDNTI